LRFAPDVEESLAFVVALVNTEPQASRSGADELATVEQLSAMLDQYPYSGRIDRTEAELAEVRETRSLLRRVWLLDRDEAALAVNRILRAAKALPYLVRHDHWDWHLHATVPEAPLAERIRVEAAMALIEVIRMNELGRLRVCEADDCLGLVLDLSRSGSKRFCSVRCGNRMNMIAFRERRAGAG
jgi:predicted RNA-binding Zn ribbon-like protein